MVSRIIRLPSVLELTGLSRSTIYQKIADGTFPADGFYEWPESEKLPYKGPKHPRAFTLSDGSPSLLAHRRFCCATRLHEANAIGQPRFAS